MMPKRRHILLILAVSVALVASFLIGRHSGAERVVERDEADGDSFHRGQQLERGRRAWFEAANLHMYLAFFDSDRLEDLPDRIEDNLWYSIPDLHGFTSNQDASEKDRKAAMSVLRRLVLYFYEHPREHTRPEEVDLSGQLADAAEKARLGNDPNNTEQKVFAEQADGASRALSGLDEVIEEGLVVLSEADQEIQTILDQLIEAREFSGRERSWSGVTIHLPRLSGRSGGGSNGQSFDHRGDGFDLVVTHDSITLNGKDYGEVSSGSIIDLRVPKKVFVDGRQRKPKKEEAQQGVGGQPATPPRVGD
tara:strand:+ start:207 stop:1127 length:921 start_codon:yes stop_codon:yes gene_type:complete